MAWTEDWAGIGDLYSTGPFTDELRVASDERKGVVGGSSLPTPDTLNVTKDFGIALESNVNNPFVFIGRFIDQTDSGGDWNGDGSPPPFWTVSSILAEIGDASLEVSSNLGVIEKDWAKQKFNLFNNYIFTIRDNTAFSGPSATSPITLTSFERKAVVVAFSVSFSNTWSLAVSAMISASFSSYSPPTFPRPAEWEGVKDDGSPKEVIMERRRHKKEFTNQSTLFDSTVDWYTFIDNVTVGGSDTVIFADDGISNINDGTYWKYDQSLAGATAIRTSDFVNMNTGGISPEPSDPASGARSFADGREEINSTKHPFAIVKWNIATGFIKFE